MKHPFASRPDDEAIDRAILTATLHPLMSNAKWVKLIALLVANSDLIQACKVKLIWEDIDVERWLLIGEETSYQFDYYANAMEAMITGIPRLGWTVYKEIEWLDFPRFSRDIGEAQDLYTIQLKIEEVGCFQINVSADNLRLYAYQRL